MSDTGAGDDPGRSGDAGSGLPRNGHARPGQPLRFDMSSMVKRSVATLYSHLVTRPTGQALRLGIESQISELAQVCISILDFSQVAVIDYSCADETVAKLIRRYQPEERPVDAYFIARGLGDYHRETIEIVLARQHLALVSETGARDLELVGSVDALQRDAWSVLETMRRATPEGVGRAVSTSPDRAERAMRELAWKRVVLYDSVAGEYVSLRSLLDATG